MQAKVRAVKDFFIFLFPRMGLLLPFFLVSFACCGFARTIVWTYHTDPLCETEPQYLMRDLREPGSSCLPRACELDSSATQIYRKRTCPDDYTSLGVDRLVLGSSSPCTGTRSIQYSYPLNKCSRWSGAESYFMTCAGVNNVTGVSRFNYKRFASGDCDSTTLFQSFTFEAAECNLDFVWILYGCGGSQTTTNPSSQSSRISPAQVGGALFFGVVAFILLT